MPRVFSPYVIRVTENAIYNTQFSFTGGSDKMTI